jgi:osmotically-inducible protein OsmY
MDSRRLHRNGRSMAALALASALACAVAMPLRAARDGARIDPLHVPSNTVHTGASTYADHELASEIVAALNRDRTLNGTSVTVVAKDGRVSLSGSARDVAQAARAEKVVRDIAGARAVAGRLDVAGG